MDEPWEEITGKRAAQRIQKDPAAQARLVERWSLLRRQWDLEPLVVFEMGLHSSTQKVRIRRSGQTAVLKIFITPDVFLEQYQALELSGRGPEVIDVDQEREALLLEFIPGTPGVNGHFDPARAGDEIARWHASSGEGLPGLVERHLAIARSCSGFGLADEALGMGSFFERLGDSGKQGLVHGDLVPENIICWKGSCRFLDPRGYFGDQAFDWATLALYSAGSDLPGMLARAEHLSGVAVHRLAAWSWLRAVLSDAQARRALEQSNKVETDTLRLARAAEPFFRRF